MKPKLLYMSCHETLERDELLIFDKLGFDIFSIGHYINPADPICSTVGSLDITINPELMEVYKRYHDINLVKAKMKNVKADVFDAYLFILHPEFVKLFDIIIVNHFGQNLKLNWDSFKEKFVVLRTVSQRIWDAGPYWSRVKRVFLSPNERFIHGRKPDAVIRQSVNEDFYSNWVGEEQSVLTINKWIKKRNQVSCWDIYKYVTKDFNRILVGFGNEDIKYAKTDVPSEEIQEYRRKSRVYFSTCSKPGAITYSFIEALMTGIPIVSIGPKLANIGSYPTFEAHNFIKHGISGFWSDDPEQIKQHITSLLNDFDMAKEFSKEAREIAIKNFSFDKCLEDWKNFFKENYSG